MISRTHRPLVLLMDELAEGVEARSYRFSDVEEWKETLRAGDPEASRVVWEETLHRAHASANLSILRSRAWFRATTTAINQESYLGFSCCLRGLLESSVDASHSLGPASLTLAEHARTIRPVLTGRHTGGPLPLPGPMEDLLVHFTHGRRLSRTERPAFPASHQAETMKTYITNTDTGDGSISDLYADLCQIAHPSFFSLEPWIQLSDDAITVATKDQRGLISALAKRHQKGIDHVLMAAVNSAAVMLKVLNVLSPEQHLTEALVGARWNLDEVGLWKRASTWLRADPTLGRRSKFL